MGIDQVSRRRLLGSTAALGVGVPVLAACGSDEGSGDAEGEATPDAGTALTTTGEVPVGGGLILDGVVVTQPEEGTFKAFSSRCTHQGCAVTSVEETINCSCHGSAFSISDGAVRNGPATSPLPAVEISVDGSDITTA